MIEYAERELIAFQSKCPHNELDSSGSCKACMADIDWRGKYYREKDTYYRVQKAPST
jgi:predicted molibdopterin-dependent oxidoreductase YjgC